MKKDTCSMKVIFALERMRILVVPLGLYGSVIDLEFSTTKVSGRAKGF
jgi:hypothetical protein